MGFLKPDTPAPPAPPPTEKELAKQKATRRSGEGYKNALKYLDTGEDMTKTTSGYNKDELDLAMEDKIEELGKLKTNERKIALDKLPESSRKQLTSHWSYDDIISRGEAMRAKQDAQAEAQAEKKASEKRFLDLKTRKKNMGRNALISSMGEGGVLGVQNNSLR